MGASLFSEEQVMPCGHVTRFGLADWLDPGGIPNSLHLLCWSGAMKTVMSPNETTIVETNFKSLAYTHVFGKPMQHRQK